MLLRASLIWACVSVCFTFGISAEWSYEGATITLAQLNITYMEPSTQGIIHSPDQKDIGIHTPDQNELGMEPSKGILTHQREMGKYGSGAVGAASGLLVVGHPRGGRASENPSDKRHGCSLPWRTTPPKEESWVALVSRGGDCSDREKVANALALNASGVLIYAKDAQAHLQKIALSSFSRERSVVVFLGHDQGEQLAKMVENGTKVYVAITRGQDVKYRVTNINRQTRGKLRPTTFVARNPVCERGQSFADCVIVTSVLFVSVSFIILMVISLAWLVFYYIQRFRYIHAKDRLARHLCNAAKKALSRIPVKNLKSGDKEVTMDNECCAICIEPYQVSDTIRILPCKHQFHKYCVDPWLLEHRTCPMCKMDILKFYGYVFSGSTETVLPMDEFDFEITLSDSEESVLQLDMVEDTSGADMEAQVPTPPPPPANPRSSTISQVMVVPRAEASAAEVSCDGWSESPVPDTPISPVHQPPVVAAPGSAAGSVLRSVIGSAKTRVIHSAKVAHSSHTPPSSAKSQESQVTSPLPEIDVCLGVRDQCPPPVDTCVPVQDKNDLEIASVCSEDFMDAQSNEDPMGLSFIAASSNSKSGLENSAIGRLATTSLEDSVLNPPQSPSVPSSADMRLSPKADSSSKESALLPSPSSRSRSLSRERSTTGHRSRSTSRRRSSSRERSTSESRSSVERRQQDSSSQSESASSTPLSVGVQQSSRPSSYVVNVSHV